MSQITNYTDGAVPGVGFVKTLTGDMGGAIPPDGAGNINTIGAHGIVVMGSGNTTAISIKNTIQLGDLSPLVGVPALTISTGDINVTLGNIHIPNTTDANHGVIYQGASTFLNNLNTNLFLGAGAGNFTLSTATNNVAIGQGDLSAITTGNRNTVVGGSTGNITSGSDNVMVGYHAGSSLTSTESSNIIIGHSGIVADSHTIRIGTTGGGAAQQNKTFIAGINGTNAGSVASVVAINGDQLGSTTITAGANITVTPGANTITIAANAGPQIVNYTNVVGGPNYTVTATDYYLGVITISPFSILFPDAPAIGRVFVVKDANGVADIFNITLTTVSGGGQFDGPSTFVMNTAFQSVSLISGDGVNYQIF